MTGWLIVMAVALALALGAWIFLTFHAQRHEARQMTESNPQLDVNGGHFHARAGGRQAMPDPREPIVPEPDGQQR
ncbi:MAG TPA: hypothetical protein VF843_03030, partial [Streptosporangiaceae bacterium]